MKALANVLAAILALPLLAAAPAAAGGDFVSNLRLLTSVPEDDHSPALSPDGKWIVFVSERTGDMQLFAGSLGRGAVVVPRPIAPNPGDDHSPQFSPDGRWLAWISTREDAFGDVWVMPFPDGKPVQVSMRGQRDSNPRWHISDSGPLLVYDTLEPDGKGRSMAARPIDWTPFEYGEASSITSLKPPFGAFVVSAPALPDQPWVLVTDDTDGNGIFNEQDRRAAWIASADGTEWRQITPPLAGLNSPRLAGRTLALSLALRDDLDVALVETPFEISRLTNVVDLVHAATRMWEDVPLDPFTPVSYLRQAYLLKPGSEEGVSAVLMAVDILESAQRAEQALAMLFFAEANSRPTPPTTAEFAYRRAVLELAKAKRDRIAPAEFKAKADTTCRHLAALAGLSPALPAQLRARILMQQASILHAQGDYAAALTVAKEISTLDGAQRRVLCQAAMLRGEIYAGLGLPAETVRAYRGIVADFPDQADLTEDASLRLAGIAADAEPDPGKRMEILKRLRDDQLVGVRSAAALLEGRLAAANGEVKDAKETWTSMLSAPDTPPRLAARAALELGSLHTQLGEYREAIQVFASITDRLRDQLFGGAPALYKKAKQRWMDEYLAKGNYELQVGDASMALATFSELASLEPASVEAWRGVLEAQSRCRVLDKKQIAAYRTRATSAPSDALAQYVYGLALSYEKTMPEETVPQLERAILLDGAVPYFHQTLGFVHEHFARLKDSPEHRAAALNEYERALTLLSASGNVRTVDYARLLINSGNAALAVGSFNRAADLYERRLELATPFDSPVNEFLMHRSAGIAFSRASRPREAVVSFTRAANLLPKVVAAGVASTGQARDIGAELQDRTALALLNAGRNAEAAGAFLAVARAAPPRSPGLVRAWRNRGFALHRQALGQAGIERDKSLNAAAAAFNEALAILTAGTVPEKTGPSSALFQMSISVSSDSETGGAMLGFSEAQERRLVLSALSRVNEDLGLSEQAVARLREQLAAPVPSKDETVAYYTTARLVALDRLGSNLQKCGRREEAAKALLEAVQTARYEARGEVSINANALSLSLPRLAELQLAGDTDAFPAGQLAATWLLAGSGAGAQATRGGSLACLDAALTAALELRNPKTSEYVLQWGLQRSRVMLARALVLERLADSIVRDQEDGLADLRAAALAAASEQVARQTIDMAAASRDGGEIKRIALLGHAILIRRSFLCGKHDEAVERMNNALAMADACGFPALRWWICAQGALVAPVPTEYADAALRELEDLVPGTADDDTGIPTALLAHCERLSVGEQISTGAWDKAWTVAERWRAARLRLTSVAYTSQPGTAGSANTLFMESAMTLRAELLGAILRIRARPLSDTAMPDTNAVRTAMDNLRTHLANGRAQRLPGAYLLAPQATPFEDACVLLDPDQRLPGGTALILSSGGRIAAWTRDGFLNLDSDASWSILENKAHIWFVLGDRLTRKVLKSTTVVNMLTFETTYTRIEDPRLSLGTSVAKWPPAYSSLPNFPEGLTEALIGADTARLTTPLVAAGTDSTRWKLQATDLQAGDVFGMLPPLGEVSATILPPAAATAADVAAMEENLASVMAATGAATVNINGQEWIAPAIPIALMPDLAEVWIAADCGRISASIGRGDNAGAVTPLRRLLYLREALGKPVEEIAEAASLLAGVEGKLERWIPAAEAASKAVDALLTKGDSESLARELSRFGSFLNDARKFEQARKAYTEAAAVYGRLKNTQRQAEMIARSGVALENDGRFQDALATFEQAATMAAGVGDKALEARQLRRKGKILLQRQNRYVDADREFSRAAALATEADSAGDALLAQLDVARVRERTGDYAESIAIASRVADAAAAQGNSLLRADALLTRALVEWAGADYFHAFKSQREGLQMADDLEDRPFQIIGHNTGGLIAWALNDTETAMREFDAALKLANMGLFKAEVASTLNNRGLVYRSTARYDAALAEFSGALAIDREESNDWGVAYSQRNIGLTHIQRGSPTDSIAPLEEAIRLATAIGDRANRTKALVAMGDAMRDIGRPGPACSSYSNALDEARAIPLPEMEWRALYGMALLARAASDLPLARKMFAGAIDVVERLRASIKIEELQDGFLLDKQSLYDEMVRLLLDEGLSREAFEFSERSRGRNFIDMLGTQKVQPKSDADKAALAREERLRKDVEGLERRTSAAQPAERQALADELAEARRRYSQFIIGLRADNPQLSSFVSVPTLDLPTLQKLLDPETRLIVYHVLPDELVAWVVGPETFNVVRTTVKRTELANVLGTFRRHLQRFDNISTEEQMLSGWLVAPVEPLLSGARRVGVIPHRELHQMPFSATRLGDGYIIDKFALFYAPSASVIQYTFARRPDSARSNKVLAIGNPNLGARNLDLPFAEKEANRVKWSFPDATVVTGSQATESWVAANIGEYGIIHIASHGEYNENLPLLSAVKMSPDSSNDGNLTTREIFGLSIKADLIALSACQTGLGKVGSGDDIVGLNRAFVYAGTHEILSSLWRVDDVATAVLIKYFYRNMAGRNRAEALRQAQLEVRSQYRHPAYWAGLFLSGDWQ
ncbi:MAG: CHAT domain-containing protein [bacterium]